MLHLNYSKILPYLVPECTKTPAYMMASKKLLFDQLCFAPVCTSGFFILLNVLELKGVAKGVQDVQEKLWTSMKVNWMLWVPANFLNFSMVPIPYQVLMANFVSIIYNTFLSYIHNHKIESSVTAVNAPKNQ